MNLEVYNPEQWLDYAHAAHKIVFQELRDPSMDRIDYALVAGDDQGAVGYATCREFDSETLYWQYGGVLPKHRNSIKAIRAFNKFLQDSVERGYKRITTYVKNDNFGYMRLLMHHEFKIVGVRVFTDEIYVEFMKGLNNGN